jgi:hypothetical protein
MGETGELEGEGMMLWHWWCSISWCGCSLHECLYTLKFIKMFSYLCSVLYIKSSSLKSSKYINFHFEKVKTKGKKLRKKFIILELGTSSVSIFRVNASHIIKVSHIHYFLTHFSLIKISGLENIFFWDMIHTNTMYFLITYIFIMRIFLFLNI